MTEQPRQANLLPARILVGDIFSFIQASQISRVGCHPFREHFSLIRFRILMYFYFPFSVICLWFRWARSLQDLKSSKEYRFAGCLLRGINRKTFAMITKVPSYPWFSIEAKTHAMSWGFPRPGIISSRLKKWLQARLRTHIGWLDDPGWSDLGDLGIGRQSADFVLPVHKGIGKEGSESNNLHNFRNELPNAGTKSNWLYWPTR